MYHRSVMGIGAARRPASAARTSRPPGGRVRAAPEARPGSGTSTPRKPGS